MKLKIETGAHRHAYGLGQKHELQATLTDMKIGQSVFVPLSFLESSQIYDVTSRLRIKHGLAFSSLREVQKKKVGRRIWRIQ